MIAKTSPGLAYPSQLSRITLSLTEADKPFQVIVTYPGARIDI
jgi:hypothetical protein